MQLKGSLNVTFVGETTSCEESDLTDEYPGTNWSIGPEQDTHAQKRRSNLRANISSR